MSDRNRAIDALIAEHAMGCLVSWWSLHPNPNPKAYFPSEVEMPDAIGDMPAQQMEVAPGEWGSIPAYSTDPAASKQLRDKMREEGWLYIVMTNIDDFTASAFRPSESIDIAAGEPQEIRHEVEETAVALVALAAHGIEAPK